MFIVFYKAWGLLTPYYISGGAGIGTARSDENRVIFFHLRDLLTFSGGSSEDMFGRIRKSERTQMME